MIVSFFSLIFILFRLHLIFAVQTNSRYDWDQCKDGFYIYGNQCFAASAGPYNYNAATSACSSLQSGATLAKIENSAINSFVIDNVLGGESSYLGAYKSSSSFRWSYDGSYVSGYTNWNSGEPNNSGGTEGCIEIDGATGGWNDMNCNTARQALCFYKFCAPSTTTSCSLSTIHGLQNQIIAKLVSQGDLVVPSRWSTSGGYIGAVARDAAESLDKIAARVDRSGTYEYGYQTAAGDYLVGRWLTGNYCSNNSRKRFSEDPVSKEHNTGCSIDLTDSQAAQWADELISKGWVYSRPTIFKNHFEFLKCKEVSVETGIRAYQTLWNENVAAEFQIPVTGELDAATIATFSEVTCNGFTYSNLIN